MRIRYLENIEKLWSEVEAYLEFSKLEVKLKPGTPKEIIEKEKELTKLANEYDELVRKEWGM